MGANSRISWTDHTFNPWWGCMKVSGGCVHCYAEKMGNRFGSYWGLTATRKTFGELHWKEPFKWDRRAGAAGDRKRVFCGSMCDWAEDHPTADEERKKLWPLIRQTPNLDWLLLTKRPERIEKLLPNDWGIGYENVWVGVTVEDQAVADTRLPILTRIPAVVRFVSAEPLLEPLDIPLGGIHWLIAGCESGPKRRRAEPDWFRDLRDRCFVSGVPFFLKQMDVDEKLTEMPSLDGTVWDEMPKSTPKISQLPLAI